MPRTPDAFGTESFSPRSRAPALGDDEVHVWAATLEIPPALRERLRLSLADDEIARAARFKSVPDAERYVAGRGILRELLGDYLSVQPSGLRFGYGASGKPELSAGGLRFNVSHAGDLALIAITRAAHVGVDVEAVIAMSDMKEVAAAQFSLEEQKMQSALPAGERLKGFFLAWTRKEAYIKAVGTGLADESDPKWILATLEPADGFVGAVAAAVPLRVSCLRWVAQDGPGSHEASILKGVQAPPNG